MHFMRTETATNARKGTSTTKTYGIRWAREIWILYKFQLGTDTEPDERTNTIESWKKKSKYMTFASVCVPFYYILRYLSANLVRIVSTMSIHLVAFFFSLFLSILLSLILIRFLVGCHWKTHSLQSKRNQTKPNQQNRTRHYSVYIKYMVHTSRGFSLSI